MSKYAFILLVRTTESSAMNLFHVNYKRKKKKRITSKEMIRIIKGTRIYLVLKSKSRKRKITSIPLVNC